MFSLIADALDYLWALSVSKGIIQIINAILDLSILKLAEQSNMISPAVSIKSLGCLIFVLIKYLVNFSCLLNQEIEPNHMFASDLRLRLRLLSKLICLYVFGNTRSGGSLRRTFSPSTTKRYLWHFKRNCKYHPCQKAHSVSAKKYNI